MSYVIKPDVVSKYNTFAVDDCCKYGTYNCPVGFSCISKFPPDRFNEPSIPTPERNSNVVALGTSDPITKVLLPAEPYVPNKLVKPIVLAILKIISRSAAPEVK